MTNFDDYLDKQLKDPLFAEDFDKADKNWDRVAGIQMADTFFGIFGLKRVHLSKDDDE
jgi:hypothetical protein